MATSIEDQLTALMALPEVALGDEWRRIYGTAPPKLSAALLRRGIAYRLQEKAYGKMPSSIARALTKGAKAAAEITPGTRFVREWNGRTIDVLATEDGMLWQGKTWRSLSAIAREVTGTAWSGPRFFGVGVYG